MSVNKMPSGEVVVYRTGYGRRVPTTVAYRTRYVGKNLKYGGFSAPAVCTVSA